MPTSHNTAASFAEAVKAHEAGDSTRLEQFRQVPARRFIASRGGHAPGHLRNMLGTYIETGEVPLDELYDPSIAGDDPIQWLTGQLWNCSDILPRDLRDGYLPEGCWTYGQAARQIRRE